jgi:apolipoprotein D and lipocalin family protein
MLTIFCLCSVAQAFAAAAEPVPLAVIDLDPQKLYGSFEEVATVAQGFSAGCTNTTFSFAAPGLQEPAPTGCEQVVAKLVVACDRGWLHPRLRGVACALDPGARGRLLVTLSVPFSAPIREVFDMILAAPDYAWLVIGHPSRRLLWILSRGPALSLTQLNDLIDELEGRFGYTQLRQRLSCTAQPNRDPSWCSSLLQSPQEAHRWFKWAAAHPFWLPDPADR